MVQPYEMTLNLPMQVPNEVISTTSQVWDILSASRNGNLDLVKKMVDECPELIYAQYNYTPPIHFAVREGHLSLVKYLLDNGAYDPAYKTYPFSESLTTIAIDRGYTEIADVLTAYEINPSRHIFNGDNGTIYFNRTKEQLEFQEAVDKEDLVKTEQILKENPEFAKDETYFWGEGILTFAAKHCNIEMTELLMRYGARVPRILKWTQFYYFERLDGATMMMQKGMNPDTMSWHEVTILHDMAQKGNIPKAELLLNYNAEINCIDDEYQSTPLGMAAKWGKIEMVEFLLNKNADPGKAGKPWATPLSWARKKGFAEIEELLLKAGAK